MFAKMNALPMLPDQSDPRCLLKLTSAHDVYESSRSKLATCLHEDVHPNNDILLDPQTPTTSSTRDNINERTLFVLVWSMAKPLSQYGVLVSTLHNLLWTRTKGPRCQTRLPFRVLDKIVAPSSRNWFRPKFSVRRFLKNGSTSTNSLMWIADQSTPENFTLFLSLPISRKVFCGSFASVLRSVHPTFSKPRFLSC